MTEAGWLVSDSPRAMLHHLRGEASERKLRLFAVACCRRIWAVLEAESARQAVEVAERLADEAATQEEGRQAASKAADALLEYGPAASPAIDVKLFALEAAYHCIAFSAQQAAGTAASYASYTVPDFSEREAQAVLLRDIFGSPFRPVHIPADWLTWNGGVIVKIARTIYEERAFDRMPILADALEDAGCDNADILRHCREPGEHVRGCWVVDLLLGKA